MCINIPGGDTFGIELSPKLRVGRCKDRSLRLGGGGGVKGVIQISRLNPPFLWGKY